MKISNIETIQNQVNEILTAARQEADNLQSQVDTANKAQEDSAAAFIAAQQAGDPKAYAEAAANQRAYKDIAQMYADKKKALDAQPLIDGAQYKEMIDQITQELDEVNASAKDEVAELLKRIRSIGSRTTEQINQANKLIHTVQHELFKDPAEMVLANGTRIHHYTLEKEYRDRNLTACIDSIMTSTEYLFKERT